MFGWGVLARTFVIKTFFQLHKRADHCAKFIRADHIFASSGTLTQKATVDILVLCNLSAAANFRLIIGVIGNYGINYYSRLIGLIGSN